MYLDNAATTKIHPLVKEAMENVSYANYNAKYYEEAIQVQDTINKCISDIADLLKIDSKQIVFTSGSSESNNYVIKGLYFKNPNAHYITSDREHSCVIEAFKFIEELGADVTIIESKGDVITTDDIIPHIKDNTKLVSIMAVNNETGIINDYENISKFLRSKNIYFHSDITQAVGKIEIDFSLFDYASMSAHKINGPKGIGIALISKEDAPVPLIHSSSQQNGNRGGTLPNALIVGMCIALKLAIDNFDENKALLVNNKKSILKFLCDNLGDDFILNFNQNTVDNIISIRIKNEINQIFLKENKDVIKASTGSSCSIGKPSYVLKSHGFTNSEIQETIRISTSMYENVNFDL